MPLAKAIRAASTSCAGETASRYVYQSAEDLADALEPILIADGWTPPGTVDKMTDVVHAAEGPVADAMPARFLPEPGDVVEVRLNTMGGYDLWVPAACIEVSGETVLVEDFLAHGRIWLHDQTDMRPWDHEKPQAPFCERHGRHWCKVCADNARALWRRAPGQHRPLFERAIYAKAANELTAAREVVADTLERFALLDELLCRAEVADQDDDLRAAHLRFEALALVQSTLLGTVDQEHVEARLKEVLGG